MSAENYLTNAGVPGCWLHHHIPSNSRREYDGVLRKLLSKGFSESSLRAQESVLQTHLALLMGQLRKQSSNGRVPVDIERWCTYFTFDFIGYLSITYLSTTHPQVLGKLVQEVRGQFVISEENTANGVNKCSYLLASIEEALQIHPPSPATHPRYTPQEGIAIDGEVVPGNMAVGVTIYAACHSRLNFRDPDQFVPERWMGTDPLCRNDRREAVQVFSYGPQSCIGRNLRYLEMKLVIANIV